MFNKHSSIFNNSKQRFSLRKLSIGLASVLLGLTFLSNSQTVKADDTNKVEIPKSEIVQKAEGNQESGQQVTDSQDSNQAQTSVNNTSVAVKQPATVENAVEKNNETTTTLNTEVSELNERKNSSIALYDSKIAGSNDEKGNLESNVTQNDQEKAKQLTTEKINQHILNKYNEIINKGDQNSNWQDGLPTHEQQEKAEIKNGTKIFVDNPGWGPRPLVNNTIVYNGKSYKYIYQNKGEDIDDNISSIFGLATASTGDDWLTPMRAFNFSNSSDEDINSDYGYSWLKDDNGNIILEHQTNRNEMIVNEGGHSWNIDKDNGHVIITDDSDTDEDTDDDFKEFDTDLDIQENLIITPEGNIVHKITFTNNGNENGYPIPLRYFTLIDTSMNGKDGTPIYFTKNGSLYIKNNGMVYGIRLLGKGTLSATDNEFARYNDSDNLSEDVSAQYAADNMNLKDPLVDDTDDTAIRVSTPEVTLDEGDSVDLWYIETAFPSDALKGKSIDEAVDDQIDLPVNDWIKELEKEKNKDKEEQHKSDNLWGSKNDESADATKKTENDENIEDAEEGREDWNDSVEDSEDLEKNGNPLVNGWNQVKKALKPKNIKSSLENIKGNLKNILKEITPKAIIGKIHSSLKNVFSKSEMKNWLVSHGIIGVLGSAEDLKEFLNSYFNLRVTMKGDMDSYHGSIRKQIQKLEKEISNTPHTIKKTALNAVKNNINKAKDNLFNKVSSIYSKSKQKLRKAEKNFAEFFKEKFQDDGEDKITGLFSKGLSAGICLVWPALVPIATEMEFAISAGLSTALKSLKNNNQDLEDKVDKPVDAVFNSIWNGFSFKVLNNTYNFGLKSLCDGLNQLLLPNIKKLNNDIDKAIDINNLY